jgi:malate dehydrogenase (oxaloacetate-decarboxylating)(NADP+)
MSRRKDALDFHSQGRPGKIEVRPTKPLTTQRDLSLAYSPGVAEPCLAIAEDPEKASLYTARSNLIAVITNGTAVLGLGNIGPLAAKPVMEGKGVLFKKFADIDVFDIELDAADPERFIETVVALEPTFGGINLEDVKAPECFFIEQELKKRLSIPVFHDDQHGTAIISGAALVNAAELQGKSLEELKVVVSGAGASAIACARFYISLGVRPENVLMTDSKGVLYEGRDHMNALKQEFARPTEARTLADAMKGADMLLGLSRAGVVSGEMLKTMAERPIVFALANPDPEIPFDEAKAARPDAIVATGRSDHDNQVNNVLGFPGIFRGALDVGATDITEEMKVAAAHALAELARRDVPESVSRAYGEDFRYGPSYIIPKPFDPRVLQFVAPAVAKAAVESGVARFEFDEVKYRARLRARLGGSTAILRRFVRRAQRNPRRIVFPEGNALTILQACAILADEGIARPVLLGRREQILETIEQHSIDLPTDGLEIIDPGLDPRADAYGAAYLEQRKRRGVDELSARKAMGGRRNYFGAMMVRQGDADGMVSGWGYSYPETIRPALEIIGLADGARRTAGMYLMLHRNGVMFFGDTTVNVDLDAQGLADVAEMVADASRDVFQVEPRVAMLSYANFGSTRSKSSQNVRRATEILHQRRPDIEADGEMQANVAVNYQLQKRSFPFTRLTDSANVLIFPNLDAGNTAYKLMRELGDVPTVGPVLLGMAKPVNVLERGCDVDSVVLMTALTVVQAQLLDQARADAL